jgi:hypothetical protein
MSSPYLPKMAREIFGEMGILFEMVAIGATVR